MNLDHAKKEPHPYHFQADPAPFTHMEFAQVNEEMLAESVRRMGLALADICTVPVSSWGNHWHA